MNPVLLSHSHKFSSAGWIKIHILGGILCCVGEGDAVVINYCICFWLLLSVQIKSIPTHHNGYAEWKNKWNKPICPFFKIQKLLVKRVQVIEHLCRVSTMIYMEYFFFHPAVPHPRQPKLFRSCCRTKKSSLELASSIFLIIFFQLRWYKATTFDFAQPPGHRTWCAKINNVSTNNYSIQLKLGNKWL